MNRSSTTSQASVCGNWNSSSPSIMSFVGLESNTQKQFWDFDTTYTQTNNHQPFINPIPTTSFTDFSSYPSSSSTSTFLPNNFHPSYCQTGDYQAAAATEYLKREDGCFGLEGGNYSNGRIGLNLGHRTYFASRETAVFDRLFKRSRGFYQANQVPRCQAEGCKLDLSNAKHYHRRHKVCEFHSKATKVLLAGGLEQRFCQQCSRFHVLAEFDELKRSCRKRLADHNRRRRKPQPGTSSELVAGNEAQNASSLMTKDSKSSDQNELHTQFDQKVAVTQLQKGPALSLGGDGATQRYSGTQITYTHQPFSSPPSFSARKSVSPSCMIYNNCCQSNLFSDASQSSGGGLDQTHQQQPEELQNLLQLGHAMFEVELL